MEIIAGTARSVTLWSPPDDTVVRPTAVRARQAFFDSLGNLSGMRFADLFAGSGAMGLEAASRGAQQVLFAENNPVSLKTIRRNVAKIAPLCPATAFVFVEGTLPKTVSKLQRLPKPDLIFADPPYPISLSLLSDLTASAPFSDWADTATLFWELPDDHMSLRPPAAPWKLISIKNVGPARFLALKITKF